jgi:hypothetical protein
MRDDPVRAALEWAAFVLLALAVLVFLPWPA